MIAISNTTTATIKRYQIVQIKYKLSWAASLRKYQIRSFYQVQMRTVSRHVRTSKIQKLTIDVIPAL